MQSRSRGITLGTTLLVLTLLVTLAFTMAGVLCSHLNLNTQRENRQLALDLANSALARGIDAIQTDANYCKYNPYANPSGEVLKVNHDGGLGYVTFNSSQAATLGLVASTNNLWGLNAVEGPDGRKVPAYTARIVGEGRVGGNRARAEVLLKIPTLPALASDGKVNLNGQVMVAAVDRYEDVAPLVLNPDTAPKLPGDVAANAKGADSVTLGPSSLITGGVQAVGNVQLADDTCRVLGELRSGCDPVTLPKFDLTKFDPVVDGRPYTKFDWTPEKSPTFSGRLRRTGSLDVSGDLKLDGAFLYVEGDVTVEGSIQGRGAIVCSGKLTVGNGALLDANNLLALMSGGDLKLTGLGRKASFVQGLVYTEGHLDLSHLTVVGSTICRQANSSLDVNDANLIYLPISENIQIAKPMTFSFNIKPGWLGSDDPAGPELFSAQVLPVPSGTKVTHEVGNESFEVDAKFKIAYTNPQDGKYKEVVIGGAEEFLEVLRDFKNSSAYDPKAQNDNGMMINFSEGESKAMESERGWGYIDKANYIAEGGATVLLSPLANNWDTYAKVFEVQPCKFVRWEDRLRVALWRQLN